MEIINECTQRLIQSIKSSELYSKFMECKNELEKDPDIMKLLNEFRRDNYYIQSSKQGHDLYDETDRIMQKYEELRQNPLVEDFLGYELAVCKMLQDINYKIMQAVDLGVSDFVDEIIL